MTPIKKHAILAAENLKSAGQAGSAKILQTAASLNSLSSLTKLWLPDLLAKGRGLGDGTGGTSSIQERFQGSLQALREKTTGAASFSHQKAGQLAASLAIGWEGLQNQTTASWKEHQHLARGSQLKAQEVAEQLGQVARDASTAVTSRLGQTCSTAKAAWKATVAKADPAAFWVKGGFSSARRRFRLHRRAVGRSFRRMAASLRRRIKARREQRSHKRLSKWLVRLLAGRAFL